MRLAIGQINSKLADKEENLQKISTFSKEMASKGVDLILFPEMSITGYNMETIKEMASSKGDDTYNTISQIAADNKINLAIGIEDKRENQLFNTLTIFNKKGNISVQYDKIHLFTGEPVREQDHLSFGNHLSLLKINEFSAGLQICYDIRFPELSRSLVLKGANLLLISAAWPEVRKEHWISLLKARAIENQCFVAAANRAGTDKDLTFAGTSMIISPTGEILKELNTIDEKIIYDDLDINLVEKTRNTLTVFNDRREDIYNIGKEI